MDRIPSWLLDLLLPATDAAVGVQVVVVLVAGGLGLVAARRRPEWRLVAIGATMLVLGLMGVRALH